MSTIGTTLAQLRKEKKMTQLELSKQLNISRSALSLYEIGKNTPDIHTLVKIADFFNVSLDYIAGRTPIRYMYNKTWVNNLPKGAFEIINDPNINDVITDVETFSEQDKEGLKTYLYGLKYKRQHSNK